MDIERARSRAAGIATALFAVALFGVALRYGWPSAGADIDESWAAVIAWAHLHGLRWGVDIVFTYGPLGFLQPNSPYTPGLFDTFVIGQAVLALGYAFIYAQCFHRLGAIARVVFAAAALYGAIVSGDALMLGAMVAAVVALDHNAARTRDDRRVWAALGIVALQINAIGLIKFSAFPLALALGGAGAWLFLRERRYHAATTWLLIWTAGLLALWTFVGGQHLGDLPAYLRTSLISATGYGAAMSLDAPATTLALGIATLVAAFATLAAAWRRDATDGSRALALCAYLALCLWIAWRASFTRADSWHTFFFFPLAACIALAPFAWRSAQRRSIALSATASLCVAAAATAAMLSLREQPGILQAGFARVTTSLPSKARDLFERHRLMVKRQLDLPTIRNLVGSARVDLFGCSQGVVLLNGFGYAPRPVIQSYAAYSEPLRRMNEAYLLGPQAPAFVLMDSCAIDGHVPTGDDGLALLALLRTYQPAAVEKIYLLMRKVPAATAAPVPALDCPCTPLALGEWIDVPGDTATLMYLRYELTLRGKLRALFLSEPMLQIEVQAGAATTGYRLPRNIASGGFLLSPMLADTQGYLAWYFDKQRVPVTRVRVVAEPASQAPLFAPAMELRLAPIAIPDAAERGQTAPGE